MRTLFPTALPRRTSRAHVLRCEPCADEVFDDDLPARRWLQVLAGGKEGLLTLGIAGAVWSSSSAMTAIIYALNRAYDLEEFRPWWHTRLLAIALTLALTIFMLLAFALVVGGADLAGWTASWIGAGEAFAQAWRLLQWPVAFALVVVAVDLVYRFAPNADTEWVWITTGALLATGLWLLGSWGFRVYVRNFSDYGPVYGGIGGVVVLLLWFYLSGFALLVGAELNAEIDRALPTHDQTPQHPAKPKKIGPRAERATGWEDGISRYRNCRCWRDPAACPVPLLRQAAERPRRGLAGARPALLRCRLSR